MRHPLLIATALPEEAMAYAHAHFDVCLEPTADLAGIWRAAREHQAIGVVVSGRTAIRRDDFEQAPSCVKAIATATVGFDHIDIDAANAVGLIVTNTPDVLTAATADLTLFLMLGACRRAKEHLALMGDGWRRALAFDEMLGMDLHGKTLGVVGLGRIGQAVAHRARAFGMSIIYHNRNRLPAALEQGATYYSSLEAMLPHAEVLCLTAPASAGPPMIDAPRLALLPKGAVFVNTGRGALVDEKALIEALESNHLAAAGLDVFHNEPAYDLRFRDLPNVLATPHIGSATAETRTAMGVRALDNVMDFLAGRTPRDLVRIESS